MQLKRHSVERMYLRQSVPMPQVVNKTILNWKPRPAAATGRQYVYVGFSRRNKIPRSSGHTISEKAIRFRHLDYNPDRAQKLNQFVRVPTSVDMQHFIQIYARVFEYNLANRHRQTRAKTLTSSFVGGINTVILLWLNTTASTAPQRLVACYLPGRVQLKERSWALLSYSISVIFLSNAIMIFGNDP